jgi:hypothetical protein
MDPETVSLSTRRPWGIRRGHSKVIDLDLRQAQRLAFAMGRRACRPVNLNEAPDDGPAGTLLWWSEMVGPVQTAWPSVVGLDAERAATIVRSGGPYSVDVHEYKETRSSKRPLLGHNPLRVLLFVDQDNCVAVTPRVG